MIVNRRSERRASGIYTYYCLKRQKTNEDARDFLPTAGRLLKSPFDLTAWEESSSRGGRTLYIRARVCSLARASGIESGPGKRRGIPRGNRDRKLRIGAFGEEKKVGDTRGPGFFAARDDC
jgi:hypothetical protein